MDATELKKYIIDNNEVIKVLENLGCHNIKEYNKDYRCGLPNHNNKTSVSIKKETLSIRVFKSDSSILRGDIFTLCMDIKSVTFPQSIKYIHNILDLKYEGYKKEATKEKVDPLEIFKKVQRRRNANNVYDIEIHNEEILDEYLPYPHIDWIREGIMPWTCEKFKIGYAPKKKRIVIPHRWWCGSDNEYIGIMGRTTIKEWEMLDIPKYFPLKSYPKSLNLYGLQENYESIQKAGYVNIVEGEKAVLKRHTKGDETFCAICGNDISFQQAKILIGLNVDIIIQLDQGIPLNHIREQAEKFYGIRNVFYVYDKWGILGEKDSPADATNKIYDYLWKYKIKYDEKERNEYIRWRENLSKN